MAEEVRGMRNQSRINDTIAPFGLPFSVETEGKPTGLLKQTLSIDRIHLSINLSLKLLWCMYILYSGHLHNDAKRKLN